MVRVPEKNFLRAWREYRRMTQGQLAEAVDTTGAVISLLESGQRGLSDKWLRRLAPILGTTPGHLLDVDPHEASSDILDIWATVPEDKRDLAREVMKTFAIQPLPPGPKTTMAEEPRKSYATRGRKGPKGV